MSPKLYFAAVLGQQTVKYFSAPKLMVKCSFEVPLQVFSNWWLAHAIYLKTSNTPLDLYNTNKLIYTLTMHENRTQVFLVHMKISVE